jgi:hypothetical protein
MYVGDAAWLCSGRRSMATSKFRQYVFFKRSFFKRTAARLAWCFGGAAVKSLVLKAFALYQQSCCTRKRAFLRFSLQNVPGG